MAEKVPQNFKNSFRFNFTSTCFSFHLCTHEPWTKSGHCEGDSGGPLFFFDTDNREVEIKWTDLVKVFLCFRYVQVGVASFGSIMDCGSKPGGFSRLTFDVMQWIRKVKVNKKYA